MKGLYDPLSEKRRISFHLFLLLWRELRVNKPGVYDVYLKTNEPVSEEKIQIWESLNGLTLPSDLKDFYLTTDGIELGWYSICNEKTSAAGLIKINKLEDFKSIKLNCINLDEETKNDDFEVFVNSFLGPGFNRWPINYELEKCLNGATVIFVFSDNQKGVFILNNDLSIHKICCTFQQYIRLAVVHLGLQDWQIWYTDDAPIPSSQQLCSLYTPERLFLNTRESHEQFSANLENGVPVSLNSRKLLNFEFSG
ncbi:hypothetical protein Smp_154740 [Schistosoma mansoni]|uniref:hypothetical protein n=1 Tax=Schistosoma mansoni TaxID=6183 RepID=UPI0001A6323F|nr:hypothetical protein Smp_154740 [Schistosoma mansoni]|eukprot:XP_018649207.1 hypothetical protein Smp_154740 [Schistosoma mansoni]